MQTTFPCYATCPKGLEDLVIGELEELGLVSESQSVGVVYFSADHLGIYRMCMWSRVASRVFIKLLGSADSAEISSDLALYTQLANIPWEQHIDINRTLAVDFTGQNDVVKNTQFGAVRSKDAIVDRLRDRVGARPDISRSDPDIRVQVRLSKNRLQVGLDMSGGSLHQRGYRTEQGVAPLKENLAAAILKRIGWPAMAADGKPLFDPMCGAGTLLVEGAMILTDCAPGRLREQFGLKHWKLFESQVWKKVAEEAEQRYAIGKQACNEQPRIFGCDGNGHVVKLAIANCQRAGFGHLISVQQQPLTTPPSSVVTAEPGLMVTNPPYGERLGDIETLRQTYLELAQYAKHHFANWTLAVFTGNRDLAKEMRMRPKKINKLMNGAIACELLLYDILPETQKALRDDQKVIQVDALSEGAKMVFNRLSKNARKLSAWLDRTKTNAYRLYDADLPEYAAAIDVYGDYILVQEYAPPKTIQKELANRRIRDVVAACSATFQCPINRVVLKTRQINKGYAQYEKQSDTGQTIEVHEGPVRYIVNLWDYLDTGLFLDHRPLRKMIGEVVAGKRFLNLFCYTGSITVAAAMGGALTSVSVDLSKTYLNWAQSNLQLNNLKSQRHSFVQSDCFKWLAECRQGFDVIVMDPPSFSNSKRMDGVLDVQRDHVALIKRCMDLLSPEGTLYFSNNLRGFKLQWSELEKFSVRDISLETIDLDFKRNSKIHYCFEIKHQRV